MNRSESVENFTSPSSGEKDVQDLIIAAREGRELTPVQWGEIKKLAEENVRRIEADPNSTPQQKAQAVWYRASHEMLDKFTDLSKSISKLLSRFGED